MKLRVIHLIRKLENIHRDLEELQQLQNTLRLNREYSVRLKNSLLEESSRLRQLKKKIMAQVVRGDMEPDSSDIEEPAETADNRKQAPAVNATDANREPEIILPGEKKSGRRKSAAPEEPARESADDEKSRPASKASVKKGDKTGGSPFQFHYQ